MLAARESYGFSTLADRWDTPHAVASEDYPYNPPLVRFRTPNGRFKAFSWRQLVTYWLLQPILTVCSYNTCLCHTEKKNVKWIANLYLKSLEDWKESTKSHSSCANQFSPTRLLVLSTFSNKIIPLFINYGKSGGGYWIFWGQHFSRLDFSHLNITPQGSEQFLGVWDGFRG